MNRDTILQLLQDHLAEMAMDFDVASLSLFGSAGRDELTDDSDVDILVTFRHPATMRGYFGLKRYLEDLLGRDVDLATDKMLKPALRPNIEEDLIHVA